MGINIFVVNTDFCIKSNKTELALDVIKHISSDTVDFAFVNNQNVIAASDIYTALCQWRWCPVIDDENNITELEFIGEKLGDEQILFSAIASFVEFGSSIVVASDEGKIWRWRFDDENCHYEIGRIVF